MRAEPKEVPVLMSKAAHDLAAANALLPATLYDIVCFHAQQAAEKSLKALLADQDIGYPYRHDLAELLSLLPEVPPALIPLREQIARLTPFAATERYENIVEPDAQKAAAATALAQLVYDSVHALVFPGPDDSPEKPADERAPEPAP